MIYAGIDEAGYGPMLGPLVVGCTAFRLDNPAKEDDPVRVAFGEMVTHPGTGARASGKLIIGDSKKIFSQQRGIGTLERNLFPFFGILFNPWPKPIRSFLSGLGAENAVNALERYPWYAPLCNDCAEEGFLFEEDEYPKTVPRTTQTRQKKNGLSELKTYMASNGCSLEAMDIALVLSKDFNDKINVYDNKATLLFQETMSLVKKLQAKFPNEDICVHIDKQSNRKDYAAILENYFKMPTKAMSESQELSHYRIKDDDRNIEIIFAIKGEGKYMSIALSSMVAKYVRELMMDCFNSYWRGKHPQLAPTAGYVQDARRFLGDLLKLSENVSHEDIMVRCR